MHSAFSDWFDYFAPDFQTTTNVRRYSEMTVVVYHLNFTIFGHDVSPSVPFIVESSDNVTRVLERRITAPTIPGVVVVNGKYDSRDRDTYHHETTIEDPPIRPVPFE